MSKTFRINCKYDTGERFKQYFDDQGPAEQYAKHLHALYPNIIITLTYFESVKEVILEREDKGFIT